MNAVLELGQFEPRNVHFAPRVPNTVLERSDFMRLMYSDHEVVLSALLVVFELKDIHPERYFNKQRCTFDPVRNAPAINALTCLERSIIARAVGNTRNYDLRASEQLACGAIKLFTSDWIDNGGKFILKVSGVWDDGNDAGITFRFVQPKAYCCLSIGAEEQERDVHHCEDQSAERIEQVYNC